MVVGALASRAADAPLPRLFRVFACALLMQLPGVAARADEGFFTDQKPPAVRAAWASVFAFVCEGPSGSYTATAFLVKKGVRGGRSDYFFITAGHAAENCHQSKRYLVEDINAPRFESDGITLSATPQRLGEVATVYVDNAYDIAVVRASTAASTQIGAPIQVSDGCDRALHRHIYAIGFPGVGQRPSLHLSREAKRWSRGEYVGLGRAQFRGAPYTYIAATVDSLPGSSGGPVIDEGGTLVGVVAKGAAARENGYRYDVDPKKPDDWQTFLVPCQGVLRILQKSGLR